MEYMKKVLLRIPESKERISLTFLSFCGEWMKRFTSVASYDVDVYEFYERRNTSSSFPRWIYLSLLKNNKLVSSFLSVNQ